jgi:hypothetical protein
MLQNAADYDQSWRRYRTLERIARGLVIAFDVALSAVL